MTLSAVPGLWLWPMMRQFHTKLDTSLSLLTSQFWHETEIFLSHHYLLNMYLWLGKIDSIWHLLVYLISECICIFVTKIPFSSLLNVHKALLKHHHWAVFARMGLPFGNFISLPFETYFSCFPKDWFYLWSVISQRIELIKFARLSRFFIFLMIPETIGNHPPASSASLRRSAGRVKFNLE